MDSSASLEIAGGIMRLNLGVVLPAAAHSEILDSERHPLGPFSGAAVTLKCFGGCHRPIAAAEKCDCLHQSFN